SSGTPVDESARSCDGAWHRPCDGAWHRPWARRGVQRCLAPGAWHRLRRGSDVEADVEHVAVADDVRLSLEPLLAQPRHLGMRARLDEVAPVDDLAADEPARDVRV